MLSIMKEILVIKDKAKRTAARQVSITFTIIIMFLGIEISLITSRAGFFFPAIGLTAPYPIPQIIFIAFPLLWWIIPYIAERPKLTGWYRVAYFAFPAELLLGVSFAQHHFYLFLTFLAVALGAALLFHLRLRQELKKQTGDSINRLAQQYSCMARRLFIVAVALLMLVPTLLYPIYGAPPEAEEKYYEDAVRRNQNEAEIVQMLYELDEGAWVTMQNAAQRQERLKRLLEYEAERMGVTQTPNLVVEVLPTGALGQYNPETTTIQISSKLLMQGDVAEVTRVLLHEFYHHYCYTIINSIDWDSPASQAAYYDEARSWRVNSEYYINGYSEYTAYKDQPLEASANNFADTELQRLINLYPNLDN